MSNATRIGQEAPDKTPSSPSRITPTLFSGLPRNLAELCVLRFFIGVAGATFVRTSAR